MHPICPYCHSSDTTSTSKDDSSSTIFEEICSAENLSKLGESICRHYKVNPAIGAVAGTALAAGISAVKSKLVTPTLIFTTDKIASYRCNTCFKTFVL